MKRMVVDETYRLSHHLPTTGIKNNGQIGKSGSDANVRNISDPDPIRLLRNVLAIQVRVYR